MVVIIIEDCVYKVTEKEYKILNKKVDEIKSADWPLSDNLSFELTDYLDRNKQKYKYVGLIMFDHRL